MKKAHPLLAQENGLDKVSYKTDSSTNLPCFKNGKNGNQVLEELARKWVRYGCADTPNEAMRILLGGIDNG